MDNEQLNEQDGLVNQPHCLSEKAGDPRIAALPKRLREARAAAISRDEEKYREWRQRKY